MIVSATKALGSLGLALRRETALLPARAEAPEPALLPLAVRAGHRRAHRRPTVTGVHKFES